MFALAPSSLMKEGAKGWRKVSSRPQDTRPPRAEVVEPFTAEAAVAAPARLPGAGEVAEVRLEAARKS